MLKRYIQFSFALVMVLLLSACASDGDMKGDMKSDMGSAAGNAALVGLLTSQLGVTSEQALGGAGAIFATAKDKMSADDFSSLTKSVPGVDSMLSAVPSGIDSSSDDMLGAAFSALGMDSSMIRDFVPLILGYVQGQGGTDMMGLLQKSLM